MSRCRGKIISCTEFNSEYNSLQNCYYENYCGKIYDSEEANIKMRALSLRRNLVLRIDEKV